MTHEQTLQALDAMEIAMAATAEGMDIVLSALSLALYPENALSRDEQDAIAKCALEMLRAIRGDIGPVAPQADATALKFD